MKHSMACACLLLAACGRGEAQKLSVALTAGDDDLTMLVANHAAGTVRVENLSVAAPSATAPGVVFAVRDAAGAAVRRCGVPLPPQGAGGPTVGELLVGTVDVSTFPLSALARQFCLAPGDYRATATLRQRDGEYVSNAAPFRILPYIPLPVDGRCTMRVPRDYRRAEAPRGVTTYTKGEDDAYRIIDGGAEGAGYAAADLEALRAEGWAPAGGDALWMYYAVRWKGRRVEMFHIRFPDRELMVAGPDTADYRAIFADCLPAGLPESAAPEDREVAD